MSDHESSPQAFCRAQLGRKPPSRALLWVCRLSLEIHQQKQEELPQHICHSRVPSSPEVHVNNINMWWLDWHSLEVAGVAFLYRAGTIKIAMRQIPLNSPTRGSWFTIGKGVRPHWTLIWTGRAGRQGPISLVDLTHFQSYLYFHLNLMTLGILKNVKIKYTCNVLAAA